MGNTNAHVEYTVCDGEGIFKVQRPPVHRALVALVRRKVRPVRGDIFANGHDDGARHGGVVDEQQATVPPLRTYPLYGWCMFLIAIQSLGLLTR